MINEFKIILTFLLHCDPVDRISSINCTNTASWNWDRNVYLIQI